MPPAVKNRRPKLFYATQAAIEPPTFIFFANDAELIHFSYRRYLENRIRDVLGFHGAPIAPRVPQPRGPTAPDRPVAGAARRPRAPVAAEPAVAAAPGSGQPARWPQPRSRAGLGVGHATRPVPPPRLV